MATIFELRLVVLTKMRERLVKKRDRRVSIGLAESQEIHGLCERERGSRVR